MNQKVISILGPSHSASTMLGAMLGSSHEFDKLFHIGEAYAYFNKNHQKYGWSRCVSSFNCRIWKPIQPNIPLEDIFRKIFTVYNFDIIIDSSKNIAWNQLQRTCIENSGYDHQFVMTWRDLPNLAKSALKRSAQPKCAIREISYYIKALREFNNIYLVNVKHLINEPGETLKEICGVLNIPYFEGKEYYWNFKHHHKFGAGITTKHINDPASASFNKKREQQVPIKIPEEVMEYINNKKEEIKELLETKVINKMILKEISIA